MFREENSAGALRREAPQSGLGRIALIGNYLPVSAGLRRLRRIFANRSLRSSGYVLDRFRWK
jgi:hypothetical protein